MNDIEEWPENFEPLPPLSPAAEEVLAECRTEALLIDPAGRKGLYEKSRRECGE